jgi:hypothetical protein
MLLEIVQVGNSSTGLDFTVTQSLCQVQHLICKVQYIHIVLFCTIMLKPKENIFTYYFETYFDFSYFTMVKRHIVYTEISSEVS